jgi:hypothetical protein
MENAESYEFKHFIPNKRNSGNLNAPNRGTELEIDVGDGWTVAHSVDCQAALNVFGPDAGGNFKGGDHTRLIDNIFQHLSSQVVVKMHGKISGCN